MATLEQILENIDPHADAVVVPDGPALTFRGLRSAVSLFKRSLADLQLPPQTAVSIVLENTVEFVVAFLAVTGSGLVASPLNPAYKREEFEFYIDDIRAPLVLVPAGAVAKGAPAVAAARQFKASVAEVRWTGQAVALEVREHGEALAKQPAKAPGAGPLIPTPAPEQTAFVLHTSGTTGRPKAVPLLHRNLVATVNNIIATYRLRETDASYLVMPLFHVHGLLAGLLAPLGSGGRVILPLKFSAKVFWEQFARHGATWYTAVPTIHQIVLRTPLPDPVPPIRFIRSCSSSLAPATFYELEARLGAPVVEAYAMTEACHQMTSNNLPPQQRKPGTVGVGQGVDVVILDPQNNILPRGAEGEISVRGQNVTPGYINNPKANEEAFTAGYFRTGDQGKIDEDGFLIITGRIKELINRGGEKISPIELDGLLLSHPAVAEAVAFGAPDEMYGQQVNAVVVLRSGAKATEKELQDHVAAKAAKFKVPAKIFFTDVMPKTATGKIQRRVIADKFAGAPAAKPKL